MRQLPDYILESTAKAVVPVDVRSIKISRTAGERIAEYMIQNGGTATTRELTELLQLEQFKFWETIKSYRSVGDFEYIPGHYKLSRKLKREYEEHGCFVSLSLESHNRRRPLPLHIKVNTDGIKRAINKIASLEAKCILTA